MPSAVGKVELHMGPQEVGGPDDLKKTIVDFIDEAKRKLLIMKTASCSATSSRRGRRNDYRKGWQGTPAESKSISP